ncbi:hypothetical protein BGZ95_011420 [Linnemannia exigua]|uniref:Uncharacterized protein n=1 Tax=Linnemannia exigua TaxID=604196 RepID=A0AAD4H574_9FUNG|nr:hypothetical protein BGZ95_011420 [Linnemannia exigua]
MPTTRTFSFVFRGKQVEVEREYASDEEELINTKPRCLWPDDGRHYGEQDDYYEEEQQWSEYEQHEDQDEVGPSVQHHHDEHSQPGWEQQEGTQSPPSPTSPISSSRRRQDYQPDACEEEHDPLPPQPTINRGYTSEAVTMVQHSPHAESTQRNYEFRDYRDYTDEEDANDIAPDDAVYTALYDDSDNEESSPLYSQEDAINPFEHIPNPEEDWLLAQERQRQRIASKDKLGIVGRGIKYPIPADILEAPSPTTTFGRTTLWPMRVQVPESSTSDQQRPSRLEIPTGPRPIFSIGPAFNPPSTSASTSSSASSSPTITAVLPAQPQSDSTLAPEDKKGCTSTSTVVTRPAKPDEIQAIYAAILGRRKVPTKDQEDQSTYQSKGLREQEGQSTYQSEILVTRQSSATGGSGSSLYGSEEEPELEEKVGVLKDYDEEVTLTAEEMFQEKVAELGPCNPSSKRHRPSADECEVEDQAAETDVDDQNSDTLLHKCQVFDRLCWSQGLRELIVGVYWFHKGERSLRSVHRRLDKFQVMSSPDHNGDVVNPPTQLPLTTNRQNTSEPSSPILSLGAGSSSSGYFSS